MNLILATTALLLLQAVSSSAQGIGGGIVEVPSTTSNRPPDPTTVWITSTVADGATTRIASIYTQQFATMYDSVATPSSGSIGLGTQTGTVGIVRQTGTSGAGVRVRGGWGVWVVGLGVGVGGALAGGALVGGMML